MTNSLNAATAFVVATLAFAPPATQARIFSQWVELGADGASSVRAITDGQCPQVVFDGVSAPMNVRAEPQQKFEHVKPAAFPVRSCELMVPPGAFAATLDGRVLPLPRPNPQRILVFGDTGCRITPKDLQNCDDPAAWPFPQIAAAAAKARPDLVIHVGDYHYREGPCPAEPKGCERSPLGYGFDAWDADFFKPAAPLLAAAPWIMVRGNHEDCARAGEGWIRFLDWLPAAPNCRDLTGIFVARLGGFGVIVVDGASAEDSGAGNSALAGVLRDQFAAVAARVPAEAWLVSHRPLNAMRAIRGAGGQPVNVTENAVQDLALGNLLPPGVRMTVAGHIHFFQAVDFGGASPPQLVVGTGGDNLDLAAVPVSVVGADINGHKIVNSVTYSGFAYMVWDRTGDLWGGTLFDADGKALNQRCRLLDRSLTCGP